MPTIAELNSVAVVVANVVECSREAVVVPDVAVGSKKVPSVM